MTGRDDEDALGDRFIEALGDADIPEGMEWTASELRVEDDRLAEDSSAAELVAMREMLNAYREQSMDWAEQRSAQMPSPQPARQGGGWLEAPQWALGTVAFCGCVMGAALYTHHQSVLVQRAAAALPAAPTQQALAADNELLLRVDVELHGTVAPTEQELGISETLGSDRAQKRHAAQQRIN